MKRIFLACCFLFYSFSIIAQDSIAIKYASLITASALRTHLQVLASDSLEGRETSKPGMVKAANYVASVFRSLGMPPLANGTYFQEFPLNNLIMGHMTINLDNKEYNDSQDFYIPEGNGEIKIESNEIVFAGYGITDSLYHWNDLEKLDIKGKVVMILDGEPVVKSGKFLFTNDTIGTNWSKDRARKLENIYGKNPRAVLVVNNDFSRNMERVKKWLTSGKLALSGADSKTENPPVIYISEGMADDFLRTRYASVSKYKSKIARKHRPVHYEINKRLTIQGNPPKVSCRNVLGYLEGTDLKDEVVVVTAHLDHLGIKNNNIYHGADDDGSGSSAMLAIAGAFAKAAAEGHRPRRSILFMNFSGEEKGLLGSKFYTDHPVFPLEKTVADLNVDMIGRMDTLHTSPDYVYIIGSNMLSDDLHEINEQSNKTYTKLNLDYHYNNTNDKLRLYYRSDHYNFAKHKVPVIFYFTGLHADYHKPTDTIDKIDFDKSARIAQLIYYTAWELSNRAERIRLKPEMEK